MRMRRLEAAFLSTLLLDKAVMRSLRSCKKERSAGCMELWLEKDRKISWSVRGETHVSI